MGVVGGGGMFGGLGGSVRGAGWERGEEECAGSGGDTCGEGRGGREAGLAAGNSWRTSWGWGIWVWGCVIGGWGGWGGGGMEGGQGGGLGKMGVLARRGLGLYGIFY